MVVRNHFFKKYNSFFITNPEVNLSNDEIEFIKNRAEWRNIHKNLIFAEGRNFFYERNKNPIIKDHFIQLSGIGYLKKSLFNFLKLERPSSKEYRHDDPNFFTNYFEGNEFKEKRCFSYFGTYPKKNLITKFENTLLVKNKNFKNFNVPEPLGYGIYENIDGLFKKTGYLALKIGSFERLGKYLSEKNLELDSILYINYKIGRSIRELHDNNLVHLQLHLNNFIYNNGELTITDFETLMKTDQLSPLEKSINETLDLYRLNKNNLEIEEIFLKRTNYAYCKSKSELNFLLEREFISGYLKKNYTETEIILKSIQNKNENNFYFINTLKKIKNSENILPEFKKEFSKLYELMLLK